MSRDQTFDTPSSLRDAWQPPRGIAIAAAAVALVAVSAVASLGRWSMWWPHSDNRQHGANLFLVFSAVVGMSGLALASLGLAARQRLALVVCGIAAGVCGWLLGFEWLVARTSEACGPGC